MNHHEGMSSLFKIETCDHPLLNLTDLDSKIGFLWFINSDMKRSWIVMILIQVCLVQLLNLPFICKPQFYHTILLNLRKKFLKIASFFCQLTDKASRTVQCRRMRCKIKTERRWETLHYRQLQLHCGFVLQNTHQGQFGSWERNISIWRCCWTWSVSGHGDVCDYCREDRSGDQDKVIIFRHLLL